MWDASACYFFHRRISHLFCTDILDNALIPGVLLEWQVLNSPHYAWSCAPNVQNMVKITSVPKLLVWVPQISESGCALVGTYPGPGTCLFSRGKRGNISLLPPAQAWGGECSNGCKALAVWGTCERPVALQVAWGWSSES